MWLVSALFALMGAVIGQVVVARLHFGEGFVARFLLVGGAVGLVMAGSLVRAYGWGVEFWAGVLVYAFACELYVFLVTLVDSSISVSLLLLLRRGSSSRAEIDHLSSSRAMVASRLEKLRMNGLLRRAGSSYALTGRGLRLLVLFRVLRVFFHRRPLPAIGRP
ncbi:MAG: hypothetical protein DME00_26910 [Candidatus Rokuibacteriota bacterium]|nr:MAG: hypothetical protein DME00_26910 [Candidatus Rokubacteria bacterium]